jgi:hypothetical protein
MCLLTKYCYAYRVMKDIHAMLPSEISGVNESFLLLVGWNRIFSDFSALDLEYMSSSRFSTEDMCQCLQVNVLNIS